MEEGLGDSSDSTPIAFPQDTQMEMDNEPIRNNPAPTITNRRYRDQMVPSMTSSFIRLEDEETSIDLRRSADSRAEVPSNVNVNVIEGQRREIGQAVRFNEGFARGNFGRVRRNSEDSTAESSNGSRRERDSGVVPVWSPASSSYSDQFGGEENGMGASSSYLQRRPQWRQLSQTG